MDANSSKPEIYQSLYAISHSLQEVIGHLERLRTADVLTASFAEVHRLAVEEIRSEINESATNSLNTTETEDAYTYQQQRLALEQQLRDSPGPPAAPGPEAEGGETNPPLDEA